MDLRAVRGLNALLARGAVEKVESHSRSRPAIAQNLHNAIEVEDVFAFETDTRLLPEFVNTTDCAVALFVLPKGSVWVEFDAVDIQTWQASGLSCDAVAEMPACVDLVTRLMH